MATEEDQVDDAEGEAAPPKGGKKGLVITDRRRCWCSAAVVRVPGSCSAARRTPTRKKKSTKLPPRYINLDPPFVVNFEAEAMVRFLQVTVGVMTRDPAVETLVKDNDPRVRNDLLMILSNQTYASPCPRSRARKRCASAASRACASSSRKWAATAARSKPCISLPS